MSPRLRMSTLLFTVFAFLVFPLVVGSGAAEAQSDTRFRVLVPNMQPEDEESSVRWGERVANAMKEHIDALGTHSVIPDDDVEEALRDFDMSMEDLDCITARQLASQLDAQLVMCGTYVDDGEQYHFEAQFVAVEQGDEMDIERHAVERRRGDTDEAAEFIFAGFQDIIEKTRYAAFCSQDYQSRNWDSALETCERAYELNPESISVLFARARTFMEMERYEESLADFQAVLELDEFHEASLENAGWVATQVNDEDLALNFYQRFLDLNPDETRIRRRVARDVADIGGYEEALELVQEGLEYDPDDVDLWEAIGSYAFRAAQARRDAVEAQDGEDAALPGGVEDLYELAIEAYNRVLDDRGAETPTAYLANTVRALLQLEEEDRAIDQARRALAENPENPQLNALLGQALYDTGRTEEAVEAMLEVRELDDAYNNLYTRLGQWSLELGNDDEALGHFEDAVAAGERSNNEVARQIFAIAYNTYIQADEYERGIELLQKAGTFEPESEVQSELDFWHGFALFRRGEQVQEAQTVESAEQAQQLFQEARDRFNAGAEYAERMPQVDLNQFLDAVEQYLEIQSAIIRRGGR